MTKNKSAISAEDVVAYITAHPDCLAHHPDLLEQCLHAAKSVSGDKENDQANIVDLSPALAARARDEARRVGLAHKSLLHVAAENMVSWRRLHHATLGLLASADLAGLCHVISAEFPIIFDVVRGVFPIPCGYILPIVFVLASGIWSSPLCFCLSCSRFFFVHLYFCEQGVVSRVPCPFDFCFAVFESALMGFVH